MIVAMEMSRLEMRSHIKHSTVLHQTPTSDKLARPAIRELTLRHADLPSRHSHKLQSSRASHASIVLFTSRALI